MESAFTVFKNSKNAKDASLKYSGTPFSYVLEQAQAGDKEALYFFILQSLDVVATAFMSLGIRGTVESGKEDINEMSHDFFNTFITTLYTLTAKHKGPFFTFDSSKFMSQEDTFIFNKFKYYMFRYAEQVGKKMYGEEAEIKGQELGQEAREEGEHENREDYLTSLDQKPDTREPGEDQQSKDFVDNNKKFMDFLRGGGPVAKKYYKTLMMLAAGESAKDVMAATGLGSDRSGLWNRKKAIKKAYDKFMAKQGNK
jgi:hypothetical protein